jgi:hypothetical protein
MSHACDAFACTLIIYFWWRYRNTDSLRAGLFIGLAIGLATWVRTQNAAFMLAPALSALYTTVRSFMRHEVRVARPALQRAIATGVGFSILFLPLMFFWRYEYSAWIVNTYAASVAPNAFDWRAPHLLSVLFSSDRGLFVWAPVTFIAIVGVWKLRQIDGTLTFLLLMMLLAQLYIVSSWVAWDGAAAFGPRFWCNMVAVFALGLGALLAGLRFVPRSTLTAAGTLFIVWNLLLILQYSIGSLPHSGPVDLGIMVRDQFVIIPSNISRLLQALTTRR